MLCDEFKKINDNIFNLWYEEYKDSDNFEERIGFDIEEFNEEFDESFIIDFPNEETSGKFYSEQYKKILSEKIRPYAEDWFDERLGELYSSLKEIAEYSEDNYIVGYRSIGLENPEKVIKNYEKGIYPKGYAGIGCCFSFEEHKAEAHHYNGGIHVILKCLIPIKSVDIKSTFILNMCPSLGREESEIRVFPSSELILINAYYEKTNEWIFSGHISILA